MYFFFSFSISVCLLIFFLVSTDCPVEVEDLNKLAQMHDPSKEDTVDYALFIACKKFISKVYTNCCFRIIY